MDKDLINDIADYQVKSQLNNTDFALYIGMKRSLWSMTKRSQKSVGLTLIRAIYKNIPELRVSVDRWLLGDCYQGSLPAHVRLSTAWGRFLDKIYRIKDKLP
jgi:hypothetical protein